MADANTPKFFITGEQVQRIVECLNSERGILKAAWPVMAILNVVEMQQRIIEPQPPLKEVSNEQ